MQGGPRGYRAVIQTGLPWVTVDGSPGFRRTPGMSAMVRWGKDRVCLESVEVGYEELKDSSSPTYGLKVMAVARFVGAGAGAGLVGTAARRPSASRPRARSSERPQGGAAIRGARADLAVAREDGGYRRVGLRRHLERVVLEELPDPRADLRADRRRALRPCCSPWRSRPSWRRPPPTPRWQTAKSRTTTSNPSRREWPWRRARWSGPAAPGLRRIRQCHSVRPRSSPRPRCTRIGHSDIHVACRAPALAPVVKMRVVSMLKLVDGARDDLVGREEVVRVPHGVARVGARALGLREGRDDAARGSDGVDLRRSELECHVGRAAAGLVPEHDERAVLDRPWVSLPRCPRVRRRR